MRTSAWAVSGPVIALAALPAAPWPWRCAASPCVPAAPAGAAGAVSLAWPFPTPPPSWRAA
eukprot:11209972-Lingulodinium_polyedra.AAC.1